MEEDYFSNLDQVLKRMSEAGLQLKWSKCSFEAQSVTYLGHQIYAQGLCPVTETVRAIKNVPKPGNVSLSLFSLWQISICTDHNPLMSLFSENKSIPPMASVCIQRWVLTLSAYQYHIVYRAENANVDALSWLALPDNSTATLCHLRPFFCWKS